jgi:hypothetical protein
VLYTRRIFEGQEWEPLMSSGSMAKPKRR